MEKRVAVCFCGMTRTGPYVVDNILYHTNKIEGKVNFFMHTWSTNKFRPIQSKSPGFIEKYGDNIDKKKLPDLIHRKFDDTYENIEKMEKNYNFTSIEIERQDKEFESNFIKLYDAPPYHWYSWWKVNQLKIQYEKIHKMKFDYTIKIRPDIIFDKNFNIQEDLNLIENNKNCFYAPGIEIKNNNRPCDVYFASTSPVMDIAADFFMYVKTSKKPERSLFLSEYLEEKGIKIQESTLDASAKPSWCLYRLENIGMDPFDLKSIRDIEIKWYLSPKK